jgi:hypothetical protein
MAGAQTQAPGQAAKDGSTANPKAAPKVASPKATAAKIPNYLAPISPQQIVKNATNTMAKAYAPQVQSLNQQQAAAQGLSDKRTADNKYYNTWLQTQMGALQAHANAADAQIQGAQSGLMAQQNALYSAQPGQLVAGADARSGNVSNNAQSSAFGQDVNANQQQNTGLLNASEQSALGTIQGNEDQRNNAQANDFNVVASQQNTQLGQLQTALTGIANNRTKLATAETGDVAKEIARLQGVEISKAQSNESFQAAEQKLGLTAATDSSTIAKNAATSTAALSNAATAKTNAATSQVRAATALSAQQQNAMNQNRDYNLNAAKFGAATAKDMYERTNSLGPYKVAAGKTPKPLSDASQNVVYTKIDQISGTLNQLIQNGATPQEAYHLLQNGGSTTLNGKSHSYTPDNIQLLNAAYNVRNGGSGLTAGDIAALKHVFGLSTPGQRYKVATPAPKGSVGAAVNGAVNGALGAIGA